MKNVNKILLSMLTCFALFFIPACTFNDTDQDPDYENKFYNPDIEELKTSGIPIVEINYPKESGSITKAEWKKDVEFIINGSFCGEDDISDTIEIKGRGNSSWDKPKKPYSIKLSGKKKILGMEKSKRWVLIANFHDKTLLRNSFAQKLGQKLYNDKDNPRWNPSFKSVHLYLNGKYRGVYLLGEQIKIDDKRVNIPDISKDEDNGGFIFEINVRMDEDFNFKTTHNVCISLKDPDEVDTSIQEKVQNIIQEAEDALFSDDFTDPANGYRKYFDVDSVIDFYLLNEITKNVDAATFSSIYFYYDPRDSEHPVHMGPNWDFDLSCGNTSENACDNYNGLYIKDKAVWIHRMFKDPYFANKVKERWNETKGDLYNYITVTIQEDADALSPAADFNFKKWPIFGKYMYYWPAGAYSRLTYQSEVDYMIDWLKARYEVVDRGLNAL